MTGSHKSICARACTHLVNGPRHPTGEGHGWHKAYNTELPGQRQNSCDEAEDVLPPGLEKEEQRGK